MSGGFAILVASLAACGGGTTSSPSSAPPASTAKSTSSPSASSSVATATYCVPLAAAYKVKPPSGVALNSAQVADMVKFGKLLGPAAEAAAADGKPGVAKLLALLGTMNASPTTVTAAQASEAAQKLSIVAPIVMADCKIDILQ